jgi:hypothetical protein
MDENDQLFTITENYKGHCCHWFVIWRKRELKGVAEAKQELFTSQAAAAFVSFARDNLSISELKVTLADTHPTKSFEDRIVEQGEELSMLLVGGEDADFAVCSFDEWDKPAGESQARH